MTKEERYPDPRFRKYLSTITRTINSGKYIVVFAPQQYGVKSFLKELTERHSLDLPPIVFLDGEELQSYPESFYYQIGVQILRKLSHLPLFQDKKKRFKDAEKNCTKRFAGRNKVTPDFIGQCLVESYHITKSPPLIIFKNIHDIGDHLREDLLKALRRWDQDANREFREKIASVIIAGSIDVCKKLTVCETSPFFNIAEQMELDGFCQGEIAALFKDNTLKEGEIKEIFRLTGGFPLHVFSAKHLLDHGAKIQELKKIIINEDPNNFLHRLEDFINNSPLFDLTLLLIRHRGSLTHPIHMKNKDLEMAYYRSLIGKDFPNEIKVINDVVLSYLVKAFDLKRTVYRFYQIKLPSLKEELKKDISDKPDIFMRLFENYESYGRLSKAFRDLDDFSKQTPSVKEFLSTVHKSFPHLFENFKLRIFQYHYSNKTLSNYMDAEDKEIVTLFDDEHKALIDNIFTRHYQKLQHALFLPTIHEDIMQGIPEYMKQEIRQYGVAIFPLKTGVNSTHLFGSITCTGPDLELTYPFLSHFFQQVQLRFLSIYQKEALTKTIRFAEPRTRKSSMGFLEEFHKFLKELFNANEVLICSKEPNGEYKLLLPHELREENIPERIKKETYIAFVGDEAKVCNKVNAEDHSFSKGLLCDYFDKKLGNRAALFFPMKNSEGQVVGVIIIINTRLFNRSTPLYSPFHELLATLLGSYGGSAWGYIKKEKRRTAGFQNIMHSLSHKIDDFSTVIHENIQTGNFPLDKAKLLKQDMEGIRDSVSENIDNLGIDDSYVKCPLHDMILRFFRDHHLESFSIDADSIDPYQEIYFSEERLKIILDNLAINASHLRNRASEPKIFFSTESDGENFILQYRDNLSGFPDSVLSAFPHGKIPSKNGLGTGLKRLWQLMQESGGDMKISNTEKGEGACIKFYFTRGHLINE